MVTEERTLAVKALREFSRFLNGNWEKEIVLMDLLQIMQENFGCSRASAYIYDQNELRLKASIGHPVLTQEPAVLNELAGSQNGSNSYSYEPVRLGSGSVYMIPLICEDRVYGVILLESEEVSKSSSYMTSIISILASVALKNMTLAEEKKMVEDIISTFTSGLDMHIYYPEFARKLKQIAPFNKLTLTIPDLFRPYELVVYSLDSADRVEIKRVLFEGSAPAWVISTGKVIIEEDLELSRSFPEDDRLLAMGIRCALRVPLRSKGRIIGTLNIGSEIPGIYNNKHIETFSEIARRIGPAVDNALIYETVNEKLGLALIQLEQNFSATLNALTVLLDKRDTGTKGHSLRVVKYSTAIAEKIGVKGKDLEEIRLGSLLHDIGKMGIPDSILFKPGKLSDSEWDVMKTHPELGADMVSRIEFLGPATPIVRYHHERFDGRGYPGQLAGREIPVGARIFAVADAFDAITSQRPYREALSMDYAVQEIRTFGGSQFCPDCVAAFMDIPFRELRGIFNECQKVITFKNPYLVGEEYVNAQMAHNLSRRK